MKTISRRLPSWLCAIGLLIMWLQSNVNILLLFLVYIFSFFMGYSINRIPFKFPEDEAAPFFQICLNKVVITLFSIIAIIGGIILFNKEEFDTCAFFIWVYLNTFSGYFSSKFDKA